jgi:hypothetical protein
MADRHVAGAMLSAKAGRDAAIFPPAIYAGNLLPGWQLKQHRSSCARGARWTWAVIGASISINRQAEAEGMFFLAVGHHCAVGTKP